MASKSNSGLEAPPFNPVPLKRAIITEQPVVGAADPAMLPPPDRRRYPPAPFR